jgi:hypothetical protein
MLPIQGAIDWLPLAILGLHFTDKWYLSKGKLWQVYMLTIVGSACTVIYNCMLWREMQFNHKSVLVFSVNSAWTIAMAVKGIVRLMNEAKTKRLPHVQMTPVPRPAKFEETDRT